MITAAFRPFLSIINRLKYGQKFLLITFLFLIPLTLLSWVWIRDVALEIHIAGEERTGVNYIRTVEPFIIDVQQHRGLANGLLNGDTSVKSQLADVETHANGTMAAIDAVDAKYGVSWGTSERWKSLRSDWDKLKKDTPTLSAVDSFAQHSAYIERLQDELSKFST